MLSRRNALTLAAAIPGVFAAGHAGHAKETAPTVRTKVNFTVPKGACDCHVHVIPDTAQFPFTAARVYTPPMATAQELLALQHALHLDHVVIVTPSIYGTDNRATLDGIKQLGRKRARGIAVVGPNTTAAEMDAMVKAGITGIRINLEQAGVTDPGAAAKALDTAVQQIGSRPWHIEMYSRLATLSPLKAKFAALPVPVVFDHFAGAQAALGAQQAGFDTVLELVKSGKAYVKVSGAYRSSDKAPDYADVQALARALIATNPDRLLWGSDWPHPDSASVPGRKTTDIAPAQMIDDGRVLNLLAEWTSDVGIRKKILVDNPKRLHGL